jgi:hypothetical protein
MLSLLLLHQQLLCYSPRHPQCPIVVIDAQHYFLLELQGNLTQVQQRSFDVGVERFHYWGR